MPSWHRDATTKNHYQYLRVHYLFSSCDIVSVHRAFATRTTRWEIHFLFRFLCFCFLASCPLISTSFYVHPNEKPYPFLFTSIAAVHSYRWPALLNSQKRSSRIPFKLFLGECMTVYYALPPPCGVLRLDTFLCNACIFPKIATIATANILCEKLLQNLWNVSLSSSSSLSKVRELSAKQPFEWMECADVVMSPYNDVRWVCVCVCTRLSELCIIYVNRFTRFGPNATGDFILKPLKGKKKTQYIFDKRIKWINDVDVLTLPFLCVSQAALTSSILVTTAKWPYLLV